MLKILFPVLGLVYSYFAYWILSKLIKQTHIGDYDMAPRFFAWIFVGMSAVSALGCFLYPFFN